MQIYAGQCGGGGTTTDMRQQSRRDGQRGVISALWTDTDVQDTMATQGVIRLAGQGPRHMGEERPGRTRG